MSDHPTLLAQPWRYPYEAGATADDILACFRLILGRYPNPEEWTGHLGLVGQDLGTVVSNYIGSAEFANRGLLAQAAPADVQLVAFEGYRIYASSLDRAVGQHVVAGQYEPHVMAVLRQHLRPGMAMLDVGANIGVFALLAALIVGPSGSVLAVEPNPANARLLEASRLANGFAHLTVLQAAAARQTGLLVLNTFDSNGTTTAPHPDRVLSAQTVGAIRLDDVVGADGKVDLVKIDVEGAEFNALSGAEATLRRCRPIIATEFSPGQMAGTDGPGYLRWLMNFGYTISVIPADGAAPGIGFTIEQIMEAYTAANVDHIDLICLPG